MANVLVTGVAGFIGSNLAIKLLADGYRVSGIDNLSGGRCRTSRVACSSTRPIFVAGRFIPCSLEPPPFSTWQR